MMRLADIVSQYAPALLEQYGHELLRGQLQALSAFQLCRSATRAQDAVVLRQLRRIKLATAFLRQPALPAVPSPRIAALDRQAAAETGAG